MKKRKEKLTGGSSLNVCLLLISESQGLFFPPLYLCIVSIGIKKIKRKRKEKVSERGEMEVKSLFGLTVSVTQFSVSITHNSKMMGPIAKRLFGQTITLFP